MHEHTIYCKNGKNNNSKNQYTTNLRNYSVQRENKAHVRNKKLTKLCTKKPYLNNYYIDLVTQLSV